MSLNQIMKDQEQPYLKLRCYRLQADAGGLHSSTVEGSTNLTLTADSGIATLNGETQAVVRAQGSGATADLISTLGNANVTSFNGNINLTADNTLVIDAPEVSLNGNVDIGGNITANIIGNVKGDVVGNVVGNLTGDIVAGNVTGSFVGNVIGNLTGDVSNPNLELSATGNITFNGNLISTRGNVDLSNTNQINGVFPFQSENGARSIISGNASDITINLGPVTRNPRIIEFSFDNSTGNLTAIENINGSWTYPSTNNCNYFFTNGTNLVVKNIFTDCIFTTDLSGVTTSQLRVTSANNTSFVLQHQTPPTVSYDFFWKCIA